MEHVDVEYRAHRARAGLDEARPLRRNHSLGVRRAVLEAERVEAGLHVFEELALLRRRLGDEQRVVVGVAAVGYLYLSVAPHVREVVPPAARDGVDYVFRASGVFLHERLAAGLAEEVLGEEQPRAAFAQLVHRAADADAEAARAFERLYDDGPRIYLARRGERLVRIFHPARNERRDARALDRRGHRVFVAAHGARRGVVAGQPGFAREQVAERDADLRARDYSFGAEFLKQRRPVYFVVVQIIYVLGVLFQIFFDRGAERARLACSRAPPPRGRSNGPTIWPQPQRYISSKSLQTLQSFPNLSIINKKRPREEASADFSYYLPASPARCSTYCRALRPEKPPCFSSQRIAPFSNSSLCASMPYWAARRRAMSRYCSCSGEK